MEALKDRIGLSLGTLWRFSDVKKLDIVKSLGFKAIEYNFGSMCQTRPSGNYDWVSVHGADLSMMPNTNKEMDFYNNLLVGGGSIVFHPNHLPEYLPLKYRDKVLIENLNIEYTGSHWNDGTQGYRVCFDTAHAYSWGVNLFKYFLREFHDTGIGHIHLSARIGTQDHQPLMKASKTFLKCMEILGGQKYMMMIEEDFSDVKELEKEVKFVRNFFK